MNNLFIAQQGTIKDKNNINNIRDYVFNHFKSNLENRETFHKYIESMPQKFQDMVYKVKHSEEITSKICKQFQKNKCDIKFLDNIDELYISHYNIDNGGDQGLFDKHYDGVLKFVKDGTIIRALVYINSEDNFVVHFIDSKKNIHFKTNEFGLLDFNREYHYVDGEYDENMKNEDDRIILKLHYMVCPNCSETYMKSLIFFNKLISFDITRTAMDYSKNPKTIFQKIIGFFCNMFRKLNNINVYLSLLFGVILLLIIFVLFYTISKYIFNFSIKNLKNKKVIKKN